jgi:hypothetical protein
MQRRAEWLVRANRLRTTSKQRVKFPSRLRYPRCVSALDQTIDLEEVIRVLVAIGIEEPCARDQFAAVINDAGRLAEVGALAVESDAGLLLSDDMPLPAALFELVDGLRQSGLAAAVGTSRAGTLMLQFNGPRPSAYELHFEAHATPSDLVRALANVVPRTHQMLLAIDYERSGALPVVILDRGSYVWFSAAVGDGALERVFARAAGDTNLVQLKACESVLPEADFAERFAWHPPDADATTTADAAFERVRVYDPRIAWPIDSRRPPGDDFYEYCNTLAAESLARCLATGDEAAWANLLYRFALATLVGANCDVLAARRNPGRSAQGILGFGQLTWAWFIFEAMGASDDAARASVLLDNTWVKSQERGSVAARQRAYYDLALYLRSGKRGPAVARVAELLALTDRAAWGDPQAVSAALAVHTEPLGDQLTHHPLYHVWPATLYALARRAAALDALPSDNPFLARPLSLSAVHLDHPVVVRLKEQLAGFDALDPEHLPPLLDPLPVIVDVRITEVNGADAHGQTLLAAHDDAEHHVVAPHAGRDMQPGEIWLLEIQGALPSSAHAHYADLGEVSVAIALPTGEWLSKV